MAQKSVVDQQKDFPSLPFEIVAEPQYDDLQLIKNTGNNLTEPINIKIRIRNKEETGKRHGAISVPKLAAHSNGKKVRLVNSDQTIMSFDFFTEADTSNTNHKKLNKNIFRIFNPGRCLRMRNDNDEDYAYLPSTLADSNKIRSTSSILDNQNNIITEKLALKKNLNSISPTNTSARIFMGKCKPGGCLDPPFGEDKYSYEPTLKRSSTSFNYVNVPDDNVEKEALRTNASSSIFDIEHDLKSKAKNKSEVVSNNANEDDYAQSIITYPSISSSNDHMRKESQDNKLKTRISNEDKARISVNEFSDVYFIPTKKNRIAERDKNERDLKAPHVTDFDDNRIHYFEKNQPKSSTPLVGNQFSRSTLGTICSDNNDTNGTKSNTIDETNKGVIKQDLKSKIQRPMSIELRLTAVVPNLGTDDINSEKITDINENFKDTDLKVNNKDLEVSQSIKSEQPEHIYFDKRINTNSNVEKIKLEDSLPVIKKILDKDFDKVANVVLSSSKIKETQNNETKSPSISASDSKGSLKAENTLIYEPDKIICIHNVESNIDKNLAVQESRQFLKKSKESFQNEIIKSADSNKIHQLFVKRNENNLKNEDRSKNDYPTLTIQNKMDQSSNISLKSYKKLSDETKLVKKELDITLKEFSPSIEEAVFADEINPLSISGNERNKEDEHKGSLDSVFYSTGPNEQIYSSKKYMESLTNEIRDKANFGEYKQAFLSKAEIDANKSISTNGSSSKLQNFSVQSGELSKTETKAISNGANAGQLSVISKGRKSSLLERRESFENKSIVKANADQLTQPSLRKAELNDVDIFQSIASANVSASNLENPLIKSQEPFTVTEVSSFMDQVDQLSVSSKEKRKNNSIGLKESFENKDKNADEFNQLPLKKPEMYETNANQSIPSALVPVKEVEHSLIKSRESFKIDNEKTSNNNHADVSSSERIKDSLIEHKESFETESGEKTKVAKLKELSLIETDLSIIKPEDTFETDIKSISNEDYIDLSSVSSKERKSITENQITKKSTDKNANINETGSPDKYEIKSEPVDFFQAAEPKISSINPEKIDNLSVTSNGKERQIEEGRLKYRFSKQNDLNAETNILSKTKQVNMLSDATIDEKFNEIKDSKELTIDTIPKTFHYQLSDTNLKTTSQPRTTEHLKTHEEINYLQKNNIAVTDNLNLQDSINFPNQSHLHTDPTHSSIAIDFGFLCSVDNDNNLVIQTFNPSSPLNENMREKISVIQSIIRVNDDEIRIPINLETDLTLQLKKPIYCKAESNFHQNKQEKDVVEQNKNKTNLDSLLQETLNSVYDNLLPIKTLIKNLKEEAYTLSCQQNSLKEILTAMETKPMRLLQTNPKCGCLINKYAINAFSDLPKNKK